MKVVLFVEDNDTDALLLQIHLAKLGFLTIVCSCVMDAILCMEKRQVDYVLTDIAMPEVSGFELIGRIRKRNKIIPIVVISAYADEYSKSEALRLGASTYIVKPAFLEDLRRVLI